MVVKAASAAEGGSRRPASARRVYRESQSASSLPVAPVKQLASFVVPAASFFAVTFGTEFAFNSFCVCVCFFLKISNLVEMWVRNQEVEAFIIDY